MPHPSLQNTIRQYINPSSIYFLIFSSSVMAISVPPTAIVNDTSKYFTHAQLRSCAWDRARECIPRAMEQYFRGIQFRWNDQCAILYDELWQSVIKLQHSTLPPRELHHQQEAQHGRQCSLFVNNNGLSYAVTTGSLRHQRPRLPIWRGCHVGWAAQLNSPAANQNVGQANLAKQSTMAPLSNASEQGSYIYL